MNFLTKSITKAQRRAVYNVWHRWHVEGAAMSSTLGLGCSYREFRRAVKPTFGMDNAVVVQVPGMWLAIEADGYTHS